VVFDVRAAQGKFGQLEKLAVDIVRTRPDVVVTHETAATLMASRATQRIPIVMAPASEPVAAANVTGLALDAAQVARQVIDLIRELKSNARRIAILANADDPSNRAFVNTLNQASARIRAPVGILRVRTVEDYEAVFAQWERLGLQALIVHPSVDLKRAAELALRYRLPAIALSGGFVEAGGLMSYAENAREVGRGVARYVERLLKGARPVALPVEAVKSFDLALNLRSAKAMEIEFPDGVLNRADAVLQ
jgi:putative ABC transport system substrate-binding protein